jgi:membrane-bound metal-dependent hydrolase YbcI (DUF457 family)
MSPTHLLIGTAAALPVADHITTGPALAAVLAGAAVGSLLPDADHIDARIHKLTRFERRHPPLSLVGYVARLPLKLVALLPHRGPVTHGAFLAPTWVLDLVGYSTATCPPLAVVAVAGAATGYLAHLLADGATMHGLPGYPFTRRVWTVPRALRVVTGSRGESRYALAAGLGLAAYLLLVFTP